MSRLTFREQVDVCWQKQLRNKFLDEGTPPVPHLDVKRAMVRPITRKLAEQIIFKYEWLGTLPASCKFYYGIFYGIYCGGVSCVSREGGGANLNTYKMFNVDANQMAYLVRGACVHWAPLGTNSKLVSYTCKILQRDKLAKLIIAYADTDAGEIGTIYQACNWIYIGQGSATEQFVSPNGKIFDQKLAYDLKRKQGGSRKRMVDALLSAGWKKQKSNPKHRYVQILDKTDKALCDRIKRMSLPYPKRQASEAGDGPDHGHSGGAAPTRTLQSDKDPCKMGGFVIKCAK